MSRALLALALLVGAAHAKQAPESGERPPNRRRAALTAAVCHKDGPRLLVKQPMQRADSDESKPTIGELPQGDDCASAVASLPDDAQVALRPASAEAGPQAAPSPQETEAAFRNSKTVGALAATLDRTASELKITGLDSFSQGRAFFDNDLSGGVTPQQRAALSKALVAELGGAPLPAAAPRPNERATPNAEPPQKGLKTNAPPAAAYDGPSGGVEPADDAGTYPYYDPRGWPGRAVGGWSPPTQILPPANPAGTPAGEYRGPTTPMDKNHTSGAVWGPFYDKFKKCRPDCEPGQFNIWRNDPGSCHSVGAAVDVFSMKCGGTVHTALQNGQFADLVACMRGTEKGPKMFAIWHQCFKNCSPANKTNYHVDHSHFSVGCGRGRY